MEKDQNCQQCHNSGVFMFCVYHNQNLCSTCINKDHTKCQLEGITNDSKEQKDLQKLSAEITTSSSKEVQPKSHFQKRLHEFLVIAMISILSFTFLTFTLLMNSYLMKGDYVKFKFPFILTLDHLISCFIYSEFSLRTFLKGKIQKMKLDRTSYTRQTTVYCLLFVANVILGNISLRFIPVSYMAVVKSSNLVFVAVIECLIFRTQYREKTLLTMGLVVVGITMATVNELSFDLRGFVAALSATIVSSFQIVLGAKLMKTKMDTFNIARLISIPSIVVLSFFILLFEINPFLDWVNSENFTLRNLFFLFLSGLIAFMLNLSNFWLMKLILSTTATIIQNLKTVVNILACVAFFKNQINIKGWLGCVICIVGCTFYGLIEKKTYDKQDLEQMKLTSKQGNKLDYENLKNQSPPVEAQK